MKCVQGFFGGEKRTAYESLQKLHYLLPHWLSRHCFHSSIVLIIFYHHIMIYCLSFTVGQKYLVEPLVMFRTLFPFEIIPAARMLSWMMLNVSISEPSCLSKYYPQIICSGWRILVPLIMTHPSNSSVSQRLPLREEMVYLTSVLWYKPWLLVLLPAPRGCELLHATP